MSANEATSSYAHDEQREQPRSGRSQNLACVGCRSRKQVRYPCSDLPRLALD